MEDNMTDQPRLYLWRPFPENVTDAVPIGTFQVDKQWNGEDYELPGLMVPVDEPLYRKCLTCAPDGVYHTAKGWPDQCPSCSSTQYVLVSND